MLEAAVAVLMVQPIEALAVLAAAVKVASEIMAARGVLVIMEPQILEAVAAVKVDGIHLHHIHQALAVLELSSCVIHRRTQSRTPAAV